ncbi:MAG: hypothetical protein IPK33_05145 [Gemmatimonadetes bacterium]|nr:hypothetical protein [Gemmatimonadota bacterium]
MATVLVPFAAAALLAASAPDTTPCVAAVGFLRDHQRMIAAVEPDTIDDWRTRQRQSGCRITAAGVTPIGVAREAVRVYDRLRVAGWTRTPDPMDAPNEASLRFRRGGVDCLFNVYDVPRLSTDAEFRVNEAVSPADGEVRYQVFVMCMPALPAAPR